MDHAVTFSISITWIWIGFWLARRWWAAPKRMVAYEPKSAIVAKAWRDR